MYLCIYFLIIILNKGLYKLSKYILVLDSKPCKQFIIRFNSSILFLIIIYYYLFLQTL